MQRPRCGNTNKGRKGAGGWGTGISLIGPAGGPPGLKSLIDLENYSATAACVSGGVRVKSGVDLNSNSILDANEVDNTKDMCFTQKADLDKVIILPVYSGYGGIIDFQTGITPVVWGDFLRFKKSNYPGVDSIILVCDPFVSDSKSTAIVKLYNVTDKTPINNSSISTSQVMPTPFAPPSYLQSANIFSSLPAHDITLGISIQSTDETYVRASFNGCYLYLYRK